MSIEWAYYGFMIRLFGVQLSMLLIMLLIKNNIEAGEQFCDKKK